MDFSTYMSKTRFREFRHMLSFMWQDEELYNKGDPWWRFQKAIDEFNGIRMKLLVYPNITCIDESMIAWRPQTTPTGGLPNISNIKRKPEDLGTEGKAAVSGFPFTVMRFLEIYKGKEGQHTYPWHTELGAGTSCLKHISLQVEDSYVDGKKVTLLQIPGLEVSKG